ncbi:MAG: tRNA adenosine(34) deaminase TadA [bacterium]
MGKSHAEFMGEALIEARKAFALGEVPIGAVVVKDDEIIGRGYNRREIDKNPLAHAEILAIGAAAAFLGGWRLLGTTMYVTLEPCAMCAGALVQARVEHLVYGAPDLKGGAVDSLYNIGQDSRLNHQFTVTRGIRIAECRALLQDFFRCLRS